jgi:hypothetical protein
MNYKDRILKSISNYSKKNDNMPKKNRKVKNDKPEAAVVLAIKNHFNALGWHLTIVEAKANYSVDAGRYMHGAVASGFSDLCGNTNDGVAVWIEVKAPGKRSSIRIEQHKFLIDKIATNSFAICADSIEYVERVYEEWRKSENRKALLLKELPELQPRLKKRVDADLIFD